MAAEVERELYGHRLDAMVGMDDDGLTDEQIDAYAEWTAKREAELFNPDGTRRLSSTVDIDLALVELAERTYRRDQRGRFARTGTVRPTGQPREKPKAPFEPGKGQRSLPGMSKAGRQPAGVKERAAQERRYTEHPYLRDVDAKQAQIRADLAGGHRDADGFLVPDGEPTVAAVDIRKPPNDKALVVRELSGRPTPGAGLELAEQHTRELGAVVDGEIRRRYGTELRHPEEVEAEYKALNNRGSEVKERYKQRTAVAVDKARRAHSDFDYVPDDVQDRWIHDVDPTLGSDFDKEWNPMLVRHHQLLAERDKAQQRYSQVAREVMGEVRPGFGEGHYNFNRSAQLKGDNAFDADLTAFAQLPKAPLKTKMAEAATYLPREWTQASNTTGLVVVPAHIIGGTAHTQSSGWSLPPTADKPGTIGLPGAMLEPGHPGAVHELTHRAENTVPDIQLLEWQFLSRRTLRSTPTTGVKDPLMREAMGDYENPQPLRAATGNDLFAPTEMSRTDDFTEPYAGRIYSSENSAWETGTTTVMPDSDFEVMTTGVEAVMYGREVIDQDHRNFATGVLAAL